MKSLAKGAEKHMKKITAKPTNKMTFLTAWSFSFACMIGWGAFMLPGTFFLPVAGLWSSLLALVFAIASISFFVVNYSFLGNLHSSSDGICRGGVYRLIQHSLNRTWAFIASWALGLAYLSCFALNAKALALLARNVLEAITPYKFHVYLIPDNLLLIDAAVILLCLGIFAYVGIRGIRNIAKVQTAGALILLTGIVVVVRHAA